MKYASELGLDSRPLRLDMAGLAHLQLPAILHWNLNHFVVLTRQKGGRFELMDPARGFVTLSAAEIGAHFTGVAVELSRGIGFRQEMMAGEGRQRLVSLALPSGLRRSVAYLVTLAAFIELLSLVNPLFLQWMVDQVSLASDMRLLATLGGAFAIATSAQFLLAVLRGRFLGRLSAMLGVGWASTLFAHLVHLPSSFFERRQVGDLISRFNSVQVLQKTLSGSFIESIFDGLMSIAALVLLFCYSPTLALVVLASFLTYLLARRFTYARVRAANEGLVASFAEQQSILAESLRGIRSLQVAGQEHRQTIRFSQAAAKAARSDLQLQYLATTFASYARWLSSVQKIVVAAAAAYLMKSSAFSPGMLIAFLAYTDQFSSRATALTDKMSDFATLSMHAERVKDIALEPRQLDRTAHGGMPLDNAAVSVQGLSFRYSDTDPWVLRYVNFTIGEGESVAIIGASGTGKSTLAKLLLGLEMPTEGAISLGGVDVKVLGHERHRHLVGAVLQDDVLFAGSIADNITFFDPDADFESLVAAAKAAIIHEDILLMPLGYETQVGDMGVSLSGGQKQRVLLARAIYRRPKVLVLDEATSHLDVANESRVNQSIGDLRMTRIIIAHRPETIRSADRIIDLTMTGAAA